MTEKQLQNMLAQGEGHFIEFKERVDKNLKKEMFAFANASGGRIFFGINDDSIIKGIGISIKLKSQIQDIAHNCDTSISIIIEEINDLLAVEVLEGVTKPYSCSSGFFMRIGGNSQKMKRDETKI